MPASMKGNVMYRSRSGTTQRRLAIGAVVLTLGLAACSSSSKHSAASSATSTAPTPDATTAASTSVAPAPSSTAPVAVSAPAGTVAAAGSVTSLTVQDYYNYDPDQGIYQTVLDSCGASIGVKIHRDIVPGASYIPKVLQEGSSKALPDVLMLDNPDVQSIAATGALTPMSAYGLSAAGSVAGVVAASTYQGQVYGLQPVANTIALFYNKTALAKAGVTPPATWADLQTAAKKLTSGSQYGIAFAAPATGEGTWTFLPFMWSNGGDEKQIATQQTADALQQWVDLVKDGAASKSVLTWTQGDVLDQFTAGKAAMMINGPWQLPALNKIQGLSYGVVPIPAPAAGQPTIGPLGGEVWTVPNTGNKDKEAAAAKIVACLYSDQNQLSLASQRQTVPTKTALQAQFIAANPSMTAFSSLVSAARSRTGELGANWPKTETAIATAIQTALTGTAAPLSALQKAQNG
jgi:multiple sugar transport system substrate-binding protein